MTEPYQVQTRKQYKNTFQRGISAEDIYGENQFGNTGVPLEGFKGDPVINDTGRFGEPMPGSDYKRDPQVPRCSANNKKGDPCGAAPVTGTDLCIGHTRQRG